jgi:hypothetical protein
LELDLTEPLASQVLTVLLKLASLLTIATIPPA